MTTIQTDRTRRPFIMEEATAVLARTPAALDALLRFTDAPLYKLAEWGLVVLLAAHLCGGLRVLVIEFLPWSGLRKDWIAATVGVSIAAGLAFALALL